MTIYETRMHLMMCIIEDPWPFFQWRASILYDAAIEEA
jgi:hypothetical protein